VIINMSTWHYRLMMFVQLDPPHNLCKYCWKLLFALFIVGAVYPVAIVLGAIAVTLPLWHVFTDDSVFTALAIFVGLVETIVLLVVLRTMIRDRWEEEIRLGERENPPPREPSLLYLWFKAKHDKVCPLIKYQG